MGSLLLPVTFPQLLNMKFMILLAVIESGKQKQFGDKPEDAGTVSQGKYSYPEDSVTYTITWVADENGFQATGDHLPVAPPMPEHVVKMLADLRAAGKL